MSCYAIGDIHGCLKTAQKLLLNEIKIKPGDHLIFLGDYVDRGPDSKGVIDFLISLKNNDDYTVELLLGNHEQKMLESIDNQINSEDWLAWGGKETLQSFNLDIVALIPEKYKEFLRELKYYTAYKNYLLVHGGFNFDIDDIFEDKPAMLWARNYTVDSEKTKGKVVVHGHTPIDEERLIALVNEDKHEINLDNGCIYHKTAGRGFLYAMDLDTKALYKARYCG